MTRQTSGCFFGWALAVSCFYFTFCILCEYNFFYYFLCYLLLRKRYLISNLKFNENCTSLIMTPTKKKKQNIYLKLLMRSGDFTIKGILIL